ncbi:MAG: YciY family protein [Enterobacteriaceae bacterium]|jgi:NADPH-dependent ferric siderophore reductase|nr:YciY family protein [Enterobacteriaceae bacterium]
MRKSRNEVGRWRLLRQKVRLRRRWFESQSRRNLRIYAMRKMDAYKHRRSILFVRHAELL